MKKYFLSIAALLIIGKLSAGTSLSDVGKGLLIITGPAYYNIENPTFEAFRANYNAFQSQDVKQQLKPLPSATKFNNMFGLFLAGAYIAYGSNKFSTASEAIDKYGQMRRMRYEAKYHNYEIGILTCIARNEDKIPKIGVGGGFCLAANYTTLYSSFTGINGYEDFGSGSRINGIYKNADGYPNLSYLLFLQAGLNLYRGITVSGKFYYNFLHNNSAHTSPLKDDMQNDMVQLNNPRFRYVPVDYSNYILSNKSDYMANIINGEVLEAVTLKYQAQMALYLPLSKELIKRNKKK